MDADLEVRSSLHLGRPLHASMYARAGILRPAQPATGAAAAAATPRLNNAPTFGVFVDQVIDVVTTQGEALAAQGEALSARIVGCRGMLVADSLRMRSAFLALDRGARSERRPRSEGLAARPWRFRSASSTLVSGMALGVLHVGWRNFWHISLDIESRFANVLVCAGIFAQECKTSGFADLLQD